MKSKFTRIVITSGPTREWLDPVRFISNPSSGQTGYQLELAARNKYSETFEEIILISGPGDPQYRNVPGIVNIYTETTEDMKRAVRGSIDNHTLLFMAAAPADFTPAEIKTQKIKKPADIQDKNTETLTTISFRPTTDILLSIKDVKYKNFIRVGFAAETENIEEYAKEKLKRKNLDYIAANYVNKDQIGFGSGSNIYYIYTKKEEVITLGPAAKNILAAELLDLILKRERSLD